MKDALDSLQRLGPDRQKTLVKRMLSSRAWWSRDGKTPDVKRFVFKEKKLCPSTKSSQLLLGGANDERDDKSAGSHGDEPCPLAAAVRRRVGLPCPAELVAHDNKPVDCGMGEESTSDPDQRCSSSVLPGRDEAFSIPGQGGPTSVSPEREEVLSEDSCSSLWTSSAVESDDGGMRGLSASAKRRMTPCTTPSKSAVSRRSPSSPKTHPTLRSRKSLSMPRAAQSFRPPPSSTPKGPHSSHRVTTATPETPRTHRTPRIRITPEAAHRQTPRSSNSRHRLTTATPETPLTHRTLRTTNRQTPRRRVSGPATLSSRATPSHPVKKETPTSIESSYSLRSRRVSTSFTANMNSSSDEDYNVSCRSGGFVGMTTADDSDDDDDDTDIDVLPFMSQELFSQNSEDWKVPPSPSGSYDGGLTPRTLETPSKESVPSVDEEAGEEEVMFSGQDGLKDSSLRRRLLVRSVGKRRHAADGGDSLKRR